METSTRVLPPASTLLSLGSPPSLGADIEKSVGHETPAVFLPTKDIIASGSRVHPEAESHGGETDSPSEKETG